MKLNEYRLSNDDSRYIITSDGKETVLTDPRNHKHTIDDVKDIACINNIPCYVYQNGKGLYSLRPALEGSGMAVDAYCYDIDSWGAYGDFEKLICPSCGDIQYFNQRQIPPGETYEVKCKNCGMLIKKKKTEASNKGDQL